MRRIGSVNSAFAIAFLFYQDLPLLKYDTDGTLSPPRQFFLLFSCFSASKAKNTGPVKIYVEIYTVFSYCSGKIEVYNALLRVLYPGSLL